MGRRRRKNSNTKEKTKSLELGFNIKP